MPQNRNKPLALQFVIRSSSSGQLDLSGITGNAPIVFPDHVAILRPREVQILAESIINSWCWNDQKVGELMIICPTNKPFDINLILDAIGNRINNDSSIHIHGAIIGFDDLERILTEWDDVNLVGCSLKSGWSRNPIRTRICTRLWIQSCKASESSRLRPGCASWARLTSLTVHEGTWDPELHSKGAFTPEPVATHVSKYGSNTSGLVSAFLGNNLESLSVFCCGSIEFLTHLPVMPNLDWIMVDGSPVTPTLSDWITGHRKLTDISLSWRPELSPPWHLLARLRKLRNLDVTGTRFCDSDLQELLKHTKLRTLHAYYTELSPNSWKLIFSAPTLRNVWVSTEMLHGDIPTDLPETTQIREVVALNVGSQNWEYLKRLLTRYPDVKSFEM